jgi:hypothetical protein
MISKLTLASGLMLSQHGEALSLSAQRKYFTFHKTSLRRAGRPPEVKTWHDLVPFDEKLPFGFCFGPRGCDEMIILADRLTAAQLFEQSRPKRT